ncbi:MAG: choice-of-anchor J domain-containing protein [Bacteroidales bacterium]|nr:choice-of-anchor J domain-containing protein [Bacteroidales bacterium]
MKKSLLFITLLTISTLGFSQTMLLEEYFNDPVNIPATWTTVDQDGDGHNWYVDTYDAEIYLVSASWEDDVVLTPENYLISPQISLAGLTGTVKLRYTIQVADEEYFAEHYKVAVSTTGNAVTDFTNIVFEETCTANDYYEVPPFWHERIVDLTPFIGQSIYLTLCHYNCTDMYKFLLDSIQVYNLDNVGVGKRDLMNLTVYPNPATDKVYVNGEFENARITLFTADGRQMYVAENESNQTYINVSGYERGMYLLQLETSKGIVTRKLAITN